MSAHQAHNGLAHEAVVWAHMICRLPNEMLVVAHHANALALPDELDLVQSRVNVISPNHSHGPISCTVIYDK